MKPPLSSTDVSGFSRRLGRMAGLLMALVGAGCFFGLGALAQEPQSNDSGDVRRGRDFRLVGVGSCTAAGCHGGGHADRVIGSEYNVWITQDPHSRAYSALFNERSQQMVRLLNGLAPNANVNAHEDPRCLACHSMTDAKPLDSRRDVVSDGVGCESCHGPAEAWLAAHTDRPFTTQERDQLGFWDTDSLLVRTQTCVRCHVGGSDREVNHDLIAAGHPRLQFEMGAYLDAMPHHWDESKDRKDRDADFDVLVWVIGQACASQAALEQLANRASKEKRWPEFAEWSCSACHHDLRVDENRYSQWSDAEVVPGRRIEWDSWNHFVTRAHAVDVSEAFRLNRDSATLVNGAMQRLNQQMQRLDPDRMQVADLARDTATNLARWAEAIEESRLEPRQLDSLTHSISKAQLKKAVLDWDSTAQTYDALASLHQSRLLHSPNETPTNDKITAAIATLYRELAPRQTSPTEYTFRPHEVRQRLVEVSELIPNSEADP